MGHGKRLRNLKLSRTWNFAKKIFHFFFSQNFFEKEIKKISKPPL